MILRYDLLSDKCLFNTPICNSNNFLQVYSISCSSMGRTEITEVFVHNCMIYHHFPLLLKDLKIWKIYASTLLHPVAHSLKYRISQHSCFFFFFHKSIFIFFHLFLLLSLWHCILRPYFLPSQFQIQFSSVLENQPFWWKLVTGLDLFAYTKYNQVRITGSLVSVSRSVVSSTSSILQKWLTINSMLYFFALANYSLSSGNNILFYIQLQRTSTKCLLYWSSPITPPFY